jgi:hypothetical protein
MEENLKLEDLDKDKFIKNLDDLNDYKKKLESFKRALFIKYMGLIENLNHLKARDDKWFLRSSISLTWSKNSCTFKTYVEMSIKYKVVKNIKSLNPSYYKLNNIVKDKHKQKVIDTMYAVIDYNISERLKLIKNILDQGLAVYQDDNYKLKSYEIKLK